MTSFDKQQALFINLTSLLSESELTNEQKLCQQIRTFLLSEDNRSHLINNMALAINFVSNLNSLNEGKVDSSFYKFIKLSSFMIENNIRFPLEESIVEESLKKLEEDGDAGNGIGAGGASAPVASNPTTNTSGVAKIEYPLGETVKRKKPDDISSPTV